MAYTQKQKEYSLKYAAERLKRIPLDVQRDFYESIKAAAAAAGLSINGYIKEAIIMRMNADKSTENP